MKFISSLIYVAAIRWYLCFGWESKLKKISTPCGDVEMKTTDCNVPQVDPNWFEASIIKARYKMRPLLTDNWEDNEDSLKAMVNEAKYNLEYVKTTWGTDRRTGVAAIRLDGNAKGTFSNLSKYCSHVIKMAKQKASEKNPGILLSLFPSSREPREKMGDSVLPGGPATSEVVHSADHFPNLSCFKASTLSDLNQVLGKDELILGLKECFLAITSGKLYKVTPNKVRYHLERWQVVEFEKAVLQVIEFLYKYNFIKQEQMQGFYASEPNILHLIAEHITIALRRGSHSVFLPQPDIDYLITSGETDHIRHCLAALDEVKQISVVHGAFASYFKSRAAWDPNEFDPELRCIDEYLTEKIHAGDISKRKPEVDKNQDPGSLESHVAQLIENFLVPCGETEKNPAFEKKSAQYMLNFLLLYYVTKNIYDHNGLRSFFDDDESRYQQFNSKFRLLVIGNWSFVLKQRWDIYESYKRLEGPKVFASREVDFEKVILKNQMESLEKEYFQLFEEMMENESCFCWLNNHLVSRIIDIYSQGMDDVTEALDVPESNPESYPTEEFQH